MAIKKAVKPNAGAEAEFIGAAPDATAQNEPPIQGVMRGNKRQITLTLPPHILPKIDAAAAEIGISRAGWIALAISKMLKE